MSERGQDRPSARSSPLFSGVGLGVIAAAGYVFVALHASIVISRGAVAALYRREAEGQQGLTGGAVWHGWVRGLGCPRALLSISCPREPTVGCPPLTRSLWVLLQGKTMDFVDVNESNARWVQDFRLKAYASPAKLESIDGEGPRLLRPWGFGVGGL